MGHGEEVEMHSKCLLQWLLAWLLLWSNGCDNKAEYEIEERVLGYQGIARQNPYLAAERYLTLDGIQTKSQHGAVKLEGNSDLIFAPATALRSLGDSERILAWVRGGGHFVCLLQRGENFWRDTGQRADHQPYRWAGDGRESELGLELMAESIGCTLVDLDLCDQGFDSFDAVARGEELPNCELVNITIQDRSYQMKLGGGRGVKRDYDRFSDWCDTFEEHRFASRQYGNGRVTFISDGRAFRNPYLKMEDHALVLERLALGSEGVVFSLGEVRSFTSMLAEYGGAPLWGLLLLIIIWLWRSLPRFGPPLDVAETHSRNYAIQLLNSGRFLWDNKQESHLLKPLRNAVLRKAGRLDGHDFDINALSEEWSVVSGLPVDDIKHAMTLSHVRDPALMLKVTQNLQQLLKSL